MNRESLIAEINKADARIAEIRNAETVDVDALSAAVIELDAVRSQLAAFDAKNIQITPASAPEAPAQSFGREVADKLAGMPVGTSVVVARTLFADPFGNDNGEQNVTHPQVSGLVTSPDAPVRFVSTLSVSPASSDAVTYVRETGFDNAAAARIAGSPAAESEITFEKVTEPIANVAHYMRAAEETLSDAPALSAVVDRRGVNGVVSKVNTMLLAPVNTANGVKSIVAAATELEYNTDTTSLIDAILTAKTSIEELGFAPSYVALSPAKYEAILKSKSDLGLYLGSGPFGGGNQTVWGLRMVVDGALPAGVDALVYDAAGATLWVRDEANVATERDIVSNLVTVRVQTRAQVAVEQAEAFVKLVPASGS